MKAASSDGLHSNHQESSSKELKSLRESHRGRPPGDLVEEEAARGEDDSKHRDELGESEDGCAWWDARTTFMSSGTVADHYLSMERSRL